MSRTEKTLWYSIVSGTAHCSWISITEIGVQTKERKLFLLLKQLERCKVYSVSNWSNIFPSWFTWWCRMDVWRSFINAYWWLRHEASRHSFSYCFRLKVPFCANPIQVRITLKVKLRFLASSVEMTEEAKRWSSLRPFLITLKWCLSTGIKPCLPDCSDGTVRGLQRCATTRSAKWILVLLQADVFVGERMVKDGIYHLPQFTHLK